MTFEELLNTPPYTLPQAEKAALLVGQLNFLTTHHRENCPEYDRLVSVLNPGPGEARTLADVPFFPVGLFKSHTLRSIPESGIFKTLTSSGTTGQEVSRIFLDQETARRQTTALGRIMTSLLGPARLPMVLVESASVVKDRRRFSARAAGVLGMMNFGRQHFYALDEQMHLDEDSLRAFLDKFGRAPFVMFGFTFMVWQYLLMPMAGRAVDLSNGILIHSGGWKKLQEMAVSNTEFKRRFREETGLEKIYNFYGMVEQVGSVYVEGEDGYLYPPNFADVIVRDPVTMREAAIGQPGIVQVVSTLPLSYPGHSLLTEDIGILHGCDDSMCGRLGKYFSILGRVPKAELRGCSDTHAATRDAA